MTEHTSTPELRFPEFKEEWREFNLKDISTKKSKKNKNKLYNETFTNSAEYGIVPQKDYFDKEISNVRNLSNYYIVDPDDFVYNPRISSLAPVGPINRNKLNRIGVMSPLYTVFSTKLSIKSFLEYYFKTTKWHKFMKLNGDSGARSDRFTIKQSLFIKMPIFLPSNQEQEKIGDFFSKLDQQIELEEKKLELLEQQKKGYMQKIFSQELRFKDDNGNDYPNWAVVKLKDILSERKEYASKTENYPHATLSTSGITLKSDRYNRDFLVKDKSKKYKVTIMNDICYNPANLKFGVITRNRIGSVIFSPIYITFEVNNGYSPLFILWAFTIIFDSKPCLKIFLSLIVFMSVFIISAKTLPGPTDGNWLLSPTIIRAVSGAMALSRVFIKYISTILISSTII